MLLLSTRQAHIIACALAGINAVLLAISITGTPSLLVTWANIGRIVVAACGFAVMALTKQQDG